MFGDILLISYYVVVYLVVQNIFSYLTLLMLFFLVVSNTNRIYGPLFIFVPE